MGRKRSTGLRIVRVSISVPIPVKDAMESVGERVNWSAVATEAFRKKLAEMKNEKGIIVRSGTHW